MKLLKALLIHFEINIFTIRSSLETYILFANDWDSKTISVLTSENIVGKGGSSLVYRGCLSDGKEIAVKILKPSEDILKEFVSEIEVITTLDHKNVISLFGFGFEDNNLLLVYEYLSRGSLEDNLHGESDNCFFLHFIYIYICKWVPQSFLFTLMSNFMIS